MGVINTSVSAVGPSATFKIPLGMANWQGMGGSGIACLVNFSGAGVGIGTSPATGTVSVQVSNDINANPNNTAAQQAVARWNNHDTLVNLTTDKNSSIVFPIAYIRLYCSVYGTGTIVLQVSWADASPPL